MTSSQSRHSARTVRTQRSANAFALGAWTGVNSTSALSERKHIAEAPAERRVSIVQPYRYRCGQGAAGRGGCGHDDLSPAPQRPRSSAPGRAGPAGLDGRPPLREDRPAPRPAEPALGARPGHLRAGQLHQDPRLPHRTPPLSASKRLGGSRSAPLQRFPSPCGALTGTKVTPKRTRRWSSGTCVYPPGSGRQRAMRTGHALRCSTLWATLPTSRAARSEWPREPITIRPAPCSLAASRMRRAAEPYMVWRRSTRARSPAASRSLAYYSASWIAPRSLRGGPRGGTPRWGRRSVTWTTTISSPSALAILAASSKGG